MPKYLFYPGCSLQRSARPYLDSIMATREMIGVDLAEIQDWNCCGATEYTSVYHVASYALVARNLALAARQADDTRTITAACSACYLNLAKTQSYLENDPVLADKVGRALSAGGLSYKAGSMKVRHLLDLVVNDVGLERVKGVVTHPLSGLRIAPYYGCMIARPDRDNRWDNVEHPMAMDRLMRVLGAEVVDFPLKTHCCGGHMTQINLTVAYELIRRIVHAASEYKADLLVTLCPMCQLNLDAYQTEVNKYFHTDYRVPVLYFSQLMGLAFGLGPELLGLGKEFVDARPALSRIGVELPATEEEGPAAAPAAPRRRGRKTGLPMPRMSGVEEAGE